MADHKHYTEEDAITSKKLTNRLYYINHRDEILAKAKGNYKPRDWTQRADNPLVKKLRASAKYKKELEDSRKLRALAAKITKVPETVRRYT